MRLVYKETQKLVKLGDVIMRRDGEEMVVKYFRRPHKASSQGKVTVEITHIDAKGVGRKTLMEYYVSVIGAEWVDREDRV